MTTEREPADDARVEALVAAVKAAHGDHIGPEQEERLRAQVRSLCAMAESLAAYPLTNADEPDVIFAAYRAE